MAIKTKDFGTLAGDYGKGVNGSLTVNFAVSGGKNCDLSCRFHPANDGGCYAVVVGARKPTVTVNLEKKEADFSGYLRALVAKLDKLVAAPWIRFSAFGSIPAPNQWSDADRENLRIIADALDHRRVHFPVETTEKAEALKALGFHPRVSDGQANDTNGQVSRVVMGHVVVTGAMPKDRAREVSAPAFEEAKRIRATGKSAVVCPAIVGNNKCGQCKACGANGADVVIYPRHV